MGARITRRDFLNGVALTAGAADAFRPEMWAAAAADLEAQDAPGYYPPAKTGLRGSHPGSFETMHKVRDGAFWEDAPKPVDTGESYDLVIVGGGISGLAAAHFFRKAAGDKARILILENHDDFGGHAKRNEFHAGSRTILGFGGTYSIESPAPYSAVAKALIEELGIDVPSYPKYVTRISIRSFGLKPHIFFDKETFGADKLVVNAMRMSVATRAVTSDAAGEAGLRDFLKDAPLSAKAKQDFQALLKDQKDYFPGLEFRRKEGPTGSHQLCEIPDGNGRRERGTRQAVPSSAAPVCLVLASTRLLPRMPGDSDYWGFDGLQLDPSPGKGMNRDAIPSEEAEKYFFHFPDGNATIARLLVRKLIPGRHSGKFRERCGAREGRLLQA